MIIIDVVNESTELMSLLSTFSSDLTTKVTSVTTCVTDISNVLVEKPPVGLLTSKSSKKSVKMPVPNMTSVSFPTPWSNFVYTPPEVKIDPSHIAVSSDGALLQAIMTSVWALLDSSISAITEAVNTAIGKFMVITESKKDILDWLSNMQNSVWGEIKKGMNELKKNVSDAKKNGDEEIAFLWNNCIKFWEKKQTSLGLLMTSLEEQVYEIITYLESTSEIETKITNISADLPKTSDETNQIVNKVTPIISNG